MDVGRRKCAAEGCDRYIRRAGSTWCRRCWYRLPEELRALVSSTAASRILPWGGGVNPRYLRAKEAAINWFAAHSLKVGA